MLNTDLGVSFHFFFFNEDIFVIKVSSRPLQKKSPFLLLRFKNNNKKKLFLCWK